MKNLRMIINSKLVNIIFNSYNKLRTTVKYKDYTINDVITELELEPFSSSNLNNIEK